MRDCKNIRKLFEHQTWFNKLFKVSDRVSVIISVQYSIEPFIYAIAQVVWHGPIDQFDDLYDDNILML